MTRMSTITENLNYDVWLHSWEEKIYYTTQNRNRYLSLLHPLANICVYNLLPVTCKIYSIAKSCYFIQSWKTSRNSE